MSNCILIGGKDVPLQLPNELSPLVLTWRDHGQQFRVGEGYNRKRVQAVDLAVWHWTGGEQSPLEMVNTLRARQLGVEFAIARNGTVYQFADPLFVDTPDAKGFNARSVGIEIVSYGMAQRPPWKCPKLGADREVKTTLIHGVPVACAGFYPVQLRAAMHLADALSRALPIPRKVPTASTTDAIVVSGVLEPKRAAVFKGHVGHYHLSRDKCDPGPAFIVELGRFFRGGPPAPAVPNA